MDLAGRRDKVFDKGPITGSGRPEVAVMICDSRLLEVDSGRRAATLRAGWSGPSFWASTASDQADVVHTYGGGAMVLGIGGFSDGKAGGPVYEIEVNEGSVNMRHFTKIANQRAANGYRMAHVYSQDRNTVVVWERTST
jgi:hypothetical protein